MRFREKEAIPAQTPITYAGRLDPMAEGLVLMLTADACKEKDTYLAREKTYDFEVLIGISTDSYDVLGRITGVKADMAGQIDEGAIAEAMRRAADKPLPYPSYSSKPVAGKPLFVYARSGEVPPSVPLQAAVPIEIECTGIRLVQLHEITREVLLDIEKVQGDFRQKEIIDSWNSCEAAHSGAALIVATFHTRVPSGVYIRSIAHALGQELAVPSLAYRIIRTRIG